MHLKIVQMQDVRALFEEKQVLRSSGSRRDKKLLSVSLENNTISPFQQLCHILVRQILGFDKSQNC